MAMKEIISGKQAACILIMYLAGSTVVLGTNISAKQDSWISIILAGVLFIPVMAVYIRIINIYPDKNFYEIIMTVFGKAFGGIIIFLYVFYSVHLGSLVIRNFSEFITVESYPETPQIIFQIFFAVFSAFMVMSGIETIGRWSRFMFPILAVAVAAIFLISLRFMDANNFLPVFGSGLGNIMSGAISTETFPFGETILFLSVLSAVENVKSKKKVIIFGTILAGLIIIVEFLRNLLVLGPVDMGEYYFPSYVSASLISLGDFFSNIEILVGGNFVLAGSVKISVCLFSACIGLKYLTGGNDYKEYAMPCGLLMITLAVIIYKNAGEMVSWIKYYNYYAVMFQIILPVIIWLGAEITNYRSKLPAAKKTS